jgi:hypothetical protein
LLLQILADDAVVQDNLRQALKRTVVEQFCKVPVVSLHHLQLLERLRAILVFVEYVLRSERGHDVANVAFQVTVEGRQFCGGQKRRNCHIAVGVKRTAKRIVR